MGDGLAAHMSSDFKLETDVAQAICELIDTPRSLTVWLLIEHKEFKQLLDLEIDPSDYQDHRNFADDYLATNILSKSANMPVEVDRSQVALDAFFCAEARCKETNDRVLRDVHPMRVQKAARLIRKVLGPLTLSKLREIEAKFRFGPGATTGVRGSGSVLSDKYDEEIHLTAELIPWYRSILGERWWSEKSRPIIVQGNKFTTVPKNAKTDRGICIEPTLNIYGQLGIGAYLKKVLLRLGVDLSSQERNQYLASQAQALKLATIDLSMASDTLSWGTVMTLLPGDWFELLEVFRCSYTTLPTGETIELEKFSSMGNGYTFELETLIFSCVAYSCVPLHDHHLVSVYGDDIIVPQYAAQEVIDALSFLGFSVNMKKSFLAGSFFESCGTDWFDGKNVRPFYLRRTEKGNIPYPVQIANAIRLYSHRITEGLCCDARFREVWRTLFLLAPRPWRRCRVPSHFGDSGFISCFNEVRPKRARDQWEGWYVRQMVCKPIYRRKRTMGRLLAALACPVPEIFTSGREPKRGYLGAPVPKRAFVSHWPGGFQWM